MKGLLLFLAGLLLGANAVYFLVTRECPAPRTDQPISVAETVAPVRVEPSPSPPVHSSSFCRADPHVIRLSRFGIVHGALVLFAIALLLRAAHVQIWQGGEWEARDPGAVGSRCLGARLEERVVLPCGQVTCSVVRSISNLSLSKVVSSAGRVRCRRARILVWRCSSCSIISRRGTGWLLPML